jgi:hypothetical protein
MQESTARLITALKERRTQDGTSLHDLTHAGPVLLVFLRHFGCTFAREAMHDLAARRIAIEAAGARLVIAHMAHPELGTSMLSRYGLKGVAHISDPDRKLYRAFDLDRGSLGQLFGPKVWIRGLSACMVTGQRLGRVVGDGMQMPGVFLLHKGRIVRSFRHRSVADRPDYVALATTAPAPPLQAAPAAS